MSLGPLKRKIHSTLGFRIAAGYSLLVLFSFFSLMAVAYLFLSSTLARSDQGLVAGELQSLCAQYRQGGEKAFEKTVLQNDHFRKNNPFFIRLIDRSGQGGRIFFPQHWRDFNLATLRHLPLGRPDTWTHLPSRNGRFELELLNARLADGSRIQVGISTEDRRALLAKLKKTFFLVTIPLLFSVLLGGALLAQRSLRPVRDLIQTVASITSGQWDARAPRTRNGDELDNLGGLFNEMIDKIHTLVDGMKDTLDAVAHDLRTPMTRFRNQAERALLPGMEPKVCREALQQCVEESDHILRMLNMLMDISEAETGTLQLNLREVDFSRLVSNVVEMYRYVGEEQGIKVAAVIAPKVRATLDPERLSQALANLLDNAVKYSTAGGRIDLTLEADSERVRIAVMDNGLGIEPDDLDRIWDRLYRGRHDHTKGIGLGLSLVRAIVTAHGGAVSGRNRPGGGAVFEVILPAVKWQPFKNVMKR